MQHIPAEFQPVAATCTAAEIEIGGEAVIAVANNTPVPLDVDPYEPLRAAVMTASERHKAHPTPENEDALRRAIADLTGLSCHVEVF